MADAVTQVVIRGKDETSAAFASVKNSVQGLTSSFGGLQGQLTSLAAQVVSVGAVIQSIHGAIKLGDDIQHFADATGLAINKLDQLSIVAKLNSADLGDFAKAFKFLGSSIIQAQDGATTAGQLFAALGVSAKDATGGLRGVDDVMGDVAKSLNDIGDETTRTAAGVALFGKSYLQVAAAIRNFEADQARANKLIEDFGGVSATAAKLSDDLGDSFTLLGEGSKRSLLNGLVPGIAAVNVALETLIGKGGDLQTAFGGALSYIAEKASIVFINIADFAQKTGLTIAAVVASIATLSLEPFKALDEDLTRLEVKRQAAIGRIKSAAAVPGIDDSDQASRAAAASTRAADTQDRLTRSKEAEAKINAILLKDGKTLADNTADYTAEILKLSDSMSDLAASGMKETAKAIEKVTADLIAGKKVTNDQIDAFLAAADAADQQALRLKAASLEANEFAKGLQLASDQEKKFAEDIVKANEAIATQNDALKLEHETLGLSDVERQIYIANLERSKQELAGNADGVALLTKQLGLLNQKAADQAFVKAVDEWRQALESVTHTFADFLVDLVEHGSSAFKRLWDTFKKWALQAFAEIAAKQVVVSLVGSLGIGGAGSVAASGLGGSPINFLDFLSGAGKAGSSLGAFGGVGAAASAGFAGANVAAATLGAGAAAEVGSAAAGAVGAGGIMAGLEVGLAAVPVAGWIALGALIIGGIVMGMKHGGPMTRDFGTSGADIGTFGDFSGTHKLVGTDAKSSTALQQIATTNETLYQVLLKAFGGTGSAQFALYTSQDTKGTASNQLDVRATVGGSLAYSANIEDQLGRDPAALQARLQLEGKRAILAALQASSLPDDIARILDSVSAISATSEQIDKILGVAGAVATLDAQIASLDTANLADAVAALEPKTLIENFRAQGQAVDDLIANFDGSIEATNALTAASGLYYQSLVQLLQQIKQVTASIDTMFAGTRESINLAGRDKDFLYQFLQQDAEARRASIKTETDPNKILADAQKINEDIGKAFNLLSPEDQASQRDAFLAGVDQINAEADARLAEIGANAQSAFKADMDVVKEQLSALIEKMTANADKDAATANVNASAADKNLAAAQTPVTVVVDIPNLAGSESNG